ncbi:MAG: NAD-dependent epimerase/dehydratase family protein [Candidatus Saganbacteria bacterium]|nr:NAD-dependent epimerase/dehydratase family protein [Candidatus Saganbacteria bacterium]
MPPNPEIIRQDIREILRADLPWKSLSGKDFLITGGSGMLASYIIELLLLLPEYVECLPPQVTALVRNREKAGKRFAAYLNSPNFKLRTDDICRDLTGTVDPGTRVIIHAASIPRPDSEVPVEVMAPNVLGTWNLLELARALPDLERFVYFSSGIVNGESIKSDVPISEDMYFASSCTGPAACYSEAKRAGETICLSFMRQYGVPVNLIRWFGCYGPGLDLHNDPRAFTSFVKSAVSGEDIVLHSTGAETRFWCYATDAIDGFFRVFFDPRCGEAWNVANDQAGCTIRELAEMARELSPRKKISVQYDANSAPAGYKPFKSPHITVPDTRKLRALGYAPKISVREGLQRTIKAYDNWGAA